MAVSADSIGHESDHVTHGVGTIYFLRKFSQTMGIAFQTIVVGSLNRFFIWKWNLLKEYIFCGSGGIIHFSIW